MFTPPHLILKYHFISFCVSCLFCKLKHQTWSMPSMSNSDNSAECDYRLIYVPRIINNYVHKMIKCAPCHVQRVRLFGRILRVRHLSCFETTFVFEIYMYQRGTDPVSFDLMILIKQVINKGRVNSCNLLWYCSPHWPHFDPKFSYPIGLNSRSQTTPLPNFESSLLPHESICHKIVIIPFLFSFQLLYNIHSIWT